MLLLLDLGPNKDTQTNIFNKWLLNLSKSSKRLTRCSDLTGLHVAHARSYLEYTSIIWNAHRGTFVDRIESDKVFYVCTQAKNASRTTVPPKIDRCELTFFYFLF